MKSVAKMCVMSPQFRVQGDCHLLLNETPVSSFMQPRTVDRYVVSHKDTWQVCGQRSFWIMQTTARLASVFSRLRYKVRFESRDFPCPLRYIFILAFIQISYFGRPWDRGGVRACTVPSCQEANCYIVQNVMEAGDCVACSTVGVCWTVLVVV